MGCYSWLENGHYAFFISIAKKVFTNTPVRTYDTQFKMLIIKIIYGTLTALYRNRINTVKYICIDITVKTFYGTLYDQSPAFDMYTSGYARRYWLGTANTTS